MTQAPRSKSTTVAPGIAEVTPRTQERTTTGRTDPVRHPEHYAQKVLHYAIERGDVLGEDEHGNVTVVFQLSKDDFDQLAAFDSD